MHVTRFVSVAILSASASMVVARPLNITSPDAILYPRALTDGGAGIADGVSGIIKGAFGIADGASKIKPAGSAPASSTTTSTTGAAPASAGLGGLGGLGSLSSLFSLLGGLRL
ncbi:hypothetical protein HGRIS_008619 [Hohenbuehelia grisea]|uniref:Uncharacterized protein n=1 Tax=Hohenbuehelia grisea TaxID=104357 RepID=A0ABR3J8P6_9AGAR